MDIEKVEVIPSLCELQMNLSESTTSESTTSESTSTTTSPTTLTDLEALKYIASNPDLIKAFGTNINKAKSHYINYGKAEGRSLDRF